MQQKKKKKSLNPGQPNSANPRGIIWGSDFRHYHTSKPHINDNDKGKRKMTTLARYDDNAGRVQQQHISTHK